MKTRNLMTFILAALIPLCCYAADSNPKEEFYRAVQFQDVPKMKALLSQGADANQIENGRPMIGWAAQAGNVEVVQALIDAKANVNVTDEGGGHSALMRAIDTQQTEIVKVLLNAKADPNYKDDRGETCLNMAVKSRKPEIVSAVIAAGADVKYVTPDGDSAALTAAQDGMPESIAIIKILGEAKANLNASNAAYTPLYYAVDQGNKELVKALLDAGADPNAKTSGGRTPLSAAIDDAAIVQLLLAAKADPNLVSGSNESALISAIEGGTPEAVAELIKGGANVNVVDGYGNTPLKVANNYSKTDMVEILKKNGATE